VRLQEWPVDQQSRVIADFPSETQVFLAEVMALSNICGRQGGYTSFAAIALDDAVNVGGYWHVWNGARDRIVQVDDGHYGVSARFCPQRGTSTVN
jgi:hypothetical protein